MKPSYIFNLNSSFGCFLLVVIIALTGCQRSGNDLAKATNDDVEESANTKRAAANREEVAGDEREVVTGDEVDAEQHEHSGASNGHDDQVTMEHSPPAGRGPGMGRGHGAGRGPGGMSGRRADMTTIHAMFADQDKIKRTVKLLPNGAETITESDDDAIVDLLQDHVPSMETRIFDNNPLPPMTFHPIFVELIKHANDYTLEYEDIKKGVKVTYEAEDPFVVMLVQEHAKLVSRFIQNGMSEIHKPYTLPEVAEDPVKDSKAIALAAKEALFARLSARLTEAIKSAGPAAAIEVCSREAASIAKTVGDEHGVKIGRTAIKLRNSQNEPPEWVKPLIQEPTAQPQFVEIENGHRGALLPIKLKAKCIICHGPADGLDRDIKKQLAKLYPKDQATGFKEGDLRGWFWVEVPTLGK